LLTLCYRYQAVQLLNSRPSRMPRALWRLCCTMASNTARCMPAHASAVLGVTHFVAILSDSGRQAKTRPCGAALSRFMWHWTTGAASLPDLGLSAHSRRALWVLTAWNAGSKKKGRLKRSALPLVQTRCSVDRKSPFVHLLAGHADASGCGPGHSPCSISYPPMT